MDDFDDDEEDEEIVEMQKEWAKAHKDFEDEDYDNEQ